MNEKALEAAAKAIYESIGPLMGNDEPWENVSWHKRAQHAKEARAAITAYLEASGEARDADRYRWLREKTAERNPDYYAHVPRWTVAQEIGGFGQCYSREALDAAIDAARNG